MKNLFKLLLLLILSANPSYAADLSNNSFKDEVSWFLPAKTLEKEFEILNLNRVVGKETHRTKEPYSDAYGDSYFTINQQSVLGGEDQQQLLINTSVLYKIENLTHRVLLIERNKGMGEHKSSEIFDAPYSYVLLKMPFSKKEWHFRIQDYYGNFKTRIRKVVGREKVKTDYAEYDALVVLETDEKGGDANKEYYAKGIGLIGHKWFNPISKKWYWMEKLTKIKEVPQ